MKVSKLSPSTAKTLLLFSSVTQLHATDVDYSCAHANSWFLNENNDIDVHYSVTTDITTSSLSSGNWRVTTNRIPKYDHIMTDADMTFLTTRPNAATDFTTGAPIVSSGNTVKYGDDIGYTGQGCDMGKT